MKTDREALVRGVAVAGVELIEKWRKDWARLLGKQALGAKLSVEEKNKLLFYRSFLVVAMDRRVQAVNN